MLSGSGHGAARALAYSRDLYAHLSSVLRRSTVLGRPPSRLPPTVDPGRSIVYRILGHKATRGARRHLSLPHNHQPTTVHFYK